MFDLKDKYQTSVSKVTELERQFDIEVVSDDSDDEEGSSNGDEDLAKVLIENELLLSESGKQWVVLSIDKCPCLVLICNDLILKKSVINITRGSKTKHGLVANII